MNDTKTQWIWRYINGGENRNYRRGEREREERESTVGLLGGDENGENCREWNLREKKDWLRKVWVNGI